MAMDDVTLGGRWGENKSGRNDPFLRGKKEARDDKPGPLKKFKRGVIRRNRKTPPGRRVMATWGKKLGKKEVSEGGRGSGGCRKNERRGRKEKNSREAKRDEPWGKI